MCDEMVRWAFSGDVYGIMLKTIFSRDLTFMSLKQRYINCMQLLKYNYIKCEMINFA